MTDNEMKKSNISRLAGIIAFALIVSVVFVVIWQLQNYIDTETAASTNAAVSESATATTGKNNTIELIHEALITNKNLSEEERGYFEKFDSFYEEYGELLLIDDLVKRLNTLDIKYRQELIDEGGLDTDAESIMASYDNKTNVIKMYQTENIQEFKYINIWHALEHEILHVLSFKTDKDYTFAGDDAFSEGMTQLLLEEYVDYGTNAYKVNRVLTQMLCELLGPDVMLCHYLNGIDTQAVIDDLAKIDADRSEAEQFMQTMGLLVYDLYWFNEDENGLYPEEAVSQIEDILTRYNNYYEKKNGRGIDEDQYLQTYEEYLITHINSNVPEPSEQYIKKNHTFIFDILTGYFSSDFRTEHPGMEIYYFKYDDEGFVVDMSESKRIAEKDRYH